VTDETIAQIMVAAVIVAVVFLARWYGRRIPNWGDLREVTLERDGDGAAIVPVTMILYRRALWSTTNGISPRLWVTGAGLRFKIFKIGEKPFGDFKQVEAYPTLLQGTRLIFVGHGERLHALIPDRAAARSVLRLLPGSLPLSPAAEALRGR
jgi:hypothetical protein